MTKEIPEDYIENYSVFRPEVSIMIHKFNDEQSEDPIYNAVINLFISDDPVRMVSTVSEIFDYEIESVIVQAVEAISMLYDEISNDEILVLDIDNDEFLESFSIDEVMAEYYANMECDDCACCPEEDEV